MGGGGSENEGSEVNLTGKEHQVGSRLLGLKASFLEGSCCVQVLRDSRPRKWRCCLFDLTRLEMPQVCPAWWVHMAQYI